MANTDSDQAHTPLLGLHAGASTTLKELSISVVGACRSRQKMRTGREGKKIKRKKRARDGGRLEKGRLVGRRHWRSPSSITFIRRLSAATGWRPDLNPDTPPSSKSGFSASPSSNSRHPCYHFSSSSLSHCLMAHWVTRRGRMRELALIADEISISARLKS